jgi:Phosphotransferase enzyme family
MDLIVSRASDVLTREFGVACAVVEPMRIGAPGRRHEILAATLKRPDNSPTPIIIKSTTSSAYDIEASTAFEDHGLVREYIAAVYIRGHAIDACPGAQLLAADGQHGLLVYEDVQANQERISLVTPLLGALPDVAELALIRYAEALGQLHSATSGALEPYVDTYQRLLPHAPSSLPIGWPVREHAAEVAKLLGGTMPIDEIIAVDAKLRSPGPWLVLRHGDPCPDNVLHCGNRAQLVDFEFSRPGHALLDGLYWRLGFPNCWCAGRSPRNVADRVENAYRRSIAAAIPVACDDKVYRHEMAHAAAAWLINRLDLRLGRSLSADVPFRVGTLRGRVLFHLTSFIELATEADALPALAALARQWLASLRRLWPDSEMLALYPAFQHTACSEFFRK